MAFIFVGYVTVYANENGKEISENHPQAAGRCMMVRKWRFGQRWATETQIKLLMPSIVSNRSTFLMGQNGKTQTMKNGLLSIKENQYLLKRLRAIIHLYK